MTANLTPGGKILAGQTAIVAGSSSGIGAGPDNQIPGLGLLSL